MTCDDRVDSEAFKLNLNLKRTINDAKIQASPRTAYSSLDPIIGSRMEMDETKTQNRSLGSRGRRSRSIVLKLFQLPFMPSAQTTRDFFLGGVYVLVHTRTQKKISVKKKVIVVCRTYGNILTV